MPVAHRHSDMNWGLFGTNMIWVNTQASGLHGADQVMLHGITSGVRNARWRVSMKQCRGLNSNPSQKGMRTKGIRTTKRENSTEMNQKRTHHDPVPNFSRPRYFPSAHSRGTSSCTGVV